MSLRCSVTLFHNRRQAPTPLTAWSGSTRCWLIRISASRIRISPAHWLVLLQPICAAFMLLMVLVTSGLQTAFFRLCNISKLMMLSVHACVFVCLWVCLHVCCLVDCMFVSLQCVCLPVLAWFWYVLLSVSNNRWIRSTHWMQLAWQPFFPLSDVMMKAGRFLWRHSCSAY